MSSSSNSTSLQTLSVLLERAEAERDEALAQLQDALAREQAARTQSGQLSQYRNDYQQRWGQQFAARGTMDIVGCYQSFGERLDQAIDSQSHVTSHAEQRVQRMRAALAEREMRCAAIAKLIERRRAELGRVAQRQEQRASDEQAARVAMAAGAHPLARV